MFKVEAIGNLGADAVVRESNGSKFVSFRIAHSEKFEKNDGSKIERTQWIDVIMSNTDSHVIPYLKQGVKVFVRGHASLRTYSSPKERMMVAGIQVNALEIELCGGSSDDVPRELINPETSELYRTSKYYWSGDASKGLKKGEFRKLIDKRGLGFVCDHQGFIIPEQSTRTDDSEQVDAK